MKTIGVIGCGLMGKGITLNLLKKAYTVYVYDPDPKTMEWIKENGANPVNDLLGLTEKVTVFISSLPTVAVVKETFMGQTGIFKNAQSGSVIIDMSTTDAESAIYLAGKAKEQNIYFYDCPVSGGPDGAEKGMLTLMVGGEETKYQKMLPLLKDIGKNIYYLGASGNGQIAKLCNNMIVAATIASFGEAFKVAEKAGVKRTALAEVLSTGSATRVFDVFGSKIVEENYEEVAFSLNHMHKDLSLYMETAAAFSSTSLIGEQTFKLFEEAKVKGKGHLDTTVVCDMH